MSETSLPSATEATPAVDPTNLPDHTQLPDKDGTFSLSFHTAPQSDLLTSTLLPRLRRLRPDGQFSIAANSGIYWRYTQSPLDGCKAPDWFCVLGVSPMLDGQFRRSYVLWHELIPPLLVVEYVYDDGMEERDTTPNTGRFWVYENGIRAAFYAIFDTVRQTLEVFALGDAGYRPVPANAAGRCPVEPLGVELGLWHGVHALCDTLWLRTWDAAGGQLLPTPDERVEPLRQLREVNARRRENQREIERLSALLHARGIDPNTV